MHYIHKLLFIAGYAYALPSTIRMHTLRERLVYAMLESSFVINSYPHIKLGHPLATNVFLFSVSFQRESIDRIEVRFLAHTRLVRC